MLTEEFDTPEPLTLAIQLGAGHIEVTAGETATTHVEVEGPRADEFAVTRHGNALAVVAPRGHGFFGSREEHQVRVVVPTDSALAVQTSSADLRAQGSFATARLKTGSGSLDVDTVTGVLTAASGSGDIACGTAGGPLRVRTGSGAVEVGRAHEDVGISTGSGEIHLGQVHKTVAAKTGSGDVVVRRSDGIVTVTTGSGGVRVSQADRGEVRAKTGTGTIAVGITAGTPVWTDISTGSGRVRSSLESLGEPAPGQPYVRLRLKTGTGDIELSPMPQMQRS